MVLSWYSKRDLSRHDNDNEQLSLLHDMEEGRVVFRRGRVSYVHWPKDTMQAAIEDHTGAFYTVDIPDKKVRL